MRLSELQLRVVCIREEQGGILQVICRFEERRNVLTRLAQACGVARVRIDHSRSGPHTVILVSFTSETSSEQRNAVQAMLTPEYCSAGSADGSITRNEVGIYTHINVCIEAPWREYSDHIERAESALKQFESDAHYPSRVERPRGQTKNVRIHFRIERTVSSPDESRNIIIAIAATMGIYVDPADCVVV
jgi:hypothetical protein